VPGRVDVIIPCHNYARYVAEAVRSAVAQTLQPRSIHVIDDGSTDDTPDVLRDVARYHPTVVVTRQPNRGLVPTLRSAISTKDGEYYAVLDADDLWSPEYLERAVERLDALPGAAYAYPQMRLFGAREGVFESQAFDPGDLVTYNFVSAGAVVRRRAYEQTQGFRPLPALEDCDLWLSFLDNGLRGTFVAEPLYWWRQSAGSRNDLDVVAFRKLHRRIRLDHPRSLIRHGPGYLRARLRSLAS
jgi:glycosyltransferase involved in cell wall biosynthesis